MSSYDRKPSAVSTGTARWTEDLGQVPYAKGPVLEKDEGQFTRAPDSPFVMQPMFSAREVPRTSTHSSRKHQKKARIGPTALKVRWARIRRRIGTEPPTSTASVPGESVGSSSYNYVDTAKTDEVDEVVVDRVWMDDIKSSEHSDHANDKESHPATGTNADVDELHADLLRSTLWLPFIIIRYRLWPWIWEFFNCRFIDPTSELHYRKENWFNKKTLALCSACWLIINWMLGTAFVPSPRMLIDKIFYYGVAPLLTFPILLMVMYDFPRDRPNLYQVVLACSVWSWSIFQLLTIYLCGYYTPSKSLFSCGKKDFIATFYYTTALQTIALFGLKLHRLPAIIGAFVFFILACVLIAPQRVTWSRAIINFVVYQTFLLYIHYMRENAERRMYSLRDQLKIQFRATQKAQVNERKSADSKRRLTSYVFHEVRVPLNTALLAVQNMAASRTVARSQDVEFKALEGSLSMMSKVLNDVLDFNRMDSGRFESVSKPYAFHQVIQSLFTPLRMATDARGIDFITELDHSVDDVARHAMYMAGGQTAAEAARRVKASDEDGLVVGDETRFRQVITNLASNACKFTPSGGKLTIRTRLVLPAAGSEDATLWSGSSRDAESSPGSPSSETDQSHALSKRHVSEHNLNHSKANTPETIVVRIEVCDTGYGIHSRDMEQSRLFSAFNQTEQGRLQGGKGTGLGLSLVRQIVKLSGGRLGVKSKVGEGSTFWVELPLGVGRKVTDLSPAGDNTSSSMLEMDELRTSDRATMQSLMEQGGLTEMLLTERELRDPNSSLSPHTLDTASSSTQFTRSKPSTSSEASSDRPPMVENTSADTVQPSRVNRPTFVRLPSSYNADLPSQNPPSVTSSSTGSYTFGSSRSQGSSSLYEPGTMNVLVVDDDVTTRMLMARLLSRLGCTVAVAENGQVALDMILEGTGLPSSATPNEQEQGAAVPCPEKYAVIFLDNQMPVLSGLKTVARLRKLCRRDFVVGVTGNALIDDQEEYIAHGVDHVLTKPVFEKSLRAMLALADERRKRD
ncbi:hypothetical protein PLICRDRAFT_667467 [Plicaturopsis crispa FD-325 SS-3]|nr:hypothetical protein PLICRDRAFT_667467 [Plicaturopsis crispa FD-325 SS-3]